MDRTNRVVNAQAIERLTVLVNNANNTVQNLRQRVQSLESMLHERDQRILALEMAVNQLRKDTIPR